ncbi:helix-turn-helix domain-containing protein [Pseudonocardia sp.]|uniref:helix-turn-helix domain-containing protein n=1 Tax=Pseudonocardia sp. TaxID=60912 RepID=UPI0031FC2C48
MHVHKNTVLYRVRKAEELLGRTSDQPTSASINQLDRTCERPLRHPPPAHGGGGHAAKALGATANGP